MAQVEIPPSPILATQGRLALSDLFLAGTVELAYDAKQGPLFVGIAGPQGSGKSTRAAELARRLRGAGFNVALLGLDDFYLRAVDRIRLGLSVHPLLVTRGVPGTHDMPLLNDVIDDLLDRRSVQRDVPMPLFDKLGDDRRPVADWTVQRSGADIIILEGWCIGARPQTPESLAQPINALEAQEDRDGMWRRYVNDALAGRYAELFARLDLRLMYSPPSFDCVFDWRAEQEAVLAAEACSGSPMDRSSLVRFVGHFERLTRWMIADKPAEIIVHLDVQRRPTGWELSPTGSVEWTSAPARTCTKPVEC